MADNSRIEELRRRVEKDPASIAFAQLAEEYRRAGRLREAIETCETGTDPAPGLPVRPRDPRSRPPRDRGVGCRPGGAEAGAAHRAREPRRAPRPRRDPPPPGRAPRSARALPHGPGVRAARRRSSSTSSARSAPSSSRRSARPASWTGSPSRKPPRNCSPSPPATATGRRASARPRFPKSRPWPPATRGWTRSPTRWWRRPRTPPPPAHSRHPHPRSPSRPPAVRPTRLERPPPDRARRGGPPACRPRTLARGHRRGAGKAKRALRVTGRRERPATGLQARRLARAPPASHARSESAPAHSGTCPGGHCWARSPAFGMIGSSFERRLCGRPRRGWSPECT